MCIFLYKWRAFKMLSDMYRARHSHSVWFSNLSLFLAAIFTIDFDWVGSSLNRYWLGTRGVIRNLLRKKFYWINIYIFQKEYHLKWSKEISSQVEKIYSHRNEPTFCSIWFKLNLTVVWIFNAAAEILNSDKYPSSQWIF